MSKYLILLSRRLPRDRRIAPPIAVSTIPASIGSFRRDQAAVQQAKTTSAHSRSSTTTYARAALTGDADRLMVAELL
jgi:hypothetical protein